MDAPVGVGMASRAGGPSRLALRLSDRIFFWEDLVQPGAKLGIVLPVCASTQDALAHWDPAVAALAALAEKVAAGDLRELAVPESEASIQAPLAPRQIFCTGANYRKHVVDIIVDRFGEKKMQEERLSASELRGWAQDMMETRARTGMPYIFTRIFTSCAGPYDDLVLPDYAREPDWEAELALVFQTGGHNIPRAQAMQHVAGYMVVNDVTSRDQIFTADPKDLGADWLHAKNSPGFFPMGPWIVPSAFVSDPYKLRIQLRLNGELMQDEDASDMIFDIPTQIETLTRYAQVLAGDVLATGSPAGNGTHYGRYLKPGDVMEASVEGLGRQSVRCVAPARDNEKPKPKGRIA